MPEESLLVVSAHAADFVWRAGGAIAATAQRGGSARVICLSYGERGESARAWREGKALDEIKALRRSEAETAAVILGARIDFLDAGDYPLRPTDELLDGIVRIIREAEPSVMLMHSVHDPYNHDHAVAADLAVHARILAQAPGYEAPGDPLGAPPVFSFEPHQPEQCNFVPTTLLNITDVFETKRKAMEVMGAQGHLIDYYTDLAKRRGVQLARNAGPNLGYANDTLAEAFQRIYPEVTEVLA